MSIACHVRGVGSSQENKSICLMLVKPSNIRCITHIPARHAPTNIKRGSLRLVFFILYFITEGNERNQHGPFDAHQTSSNKLCSYHEIHIYNWFGELDAQDIPIYTPENNWCKLYSSSKLEDQFSTRLPPFVNIRLQQFKKTVINSMYTRSTCSGKQTTGQLHIEDER